MDTQLSHLITVRFRKTAGGSVTATSEDLPGLFLTHLDRQQIIDDLPEAIQLLFKMNHNEDVVVYLLDSAADPPELKDDKLPLAAIRKEFLQL